MGLIIIVISASADPYIFRVDEFCPTCSGPTHILYYGFLHLIYVFRGEISLFYGFHDMFTLPVRVPACNICSHRDDFCSRGSTQLHICFTRSNTRRDKKSTPSHALNGFPPGNFLLHGFGTRAKIQAAFSHSNLLLRNRDATVGSAFFLRHDSRSRHGKTAGSCCSWPGIYYDRTIQTSSDLPITTTMTGCQRP